MRFFAIFMLCLALAGCSSSNTSVDETTFSPTAAAAQYWVMRQTPSNVCRVQASTEAPIGVRFKGPYPTRAKAKEVMCKEIDPNLEDQNKCWEVTPKDSCGK